jgi:hypothetical protein
MPTIHFMVTGDQGAAPVGLSDHRRAGRPCHRTGLDHDASGRRRKAEAGRLWAARAAGGVCGWLIPPELLESVRRQRGVDGRAGDRAVAEPSLDGTGIVTLVGKGIATGVAEHVRVGLERKTSGLGGPFNHPSEAGRCERGASLADEDEWRRFALPLEPPQGSRFVTPKRRCCS